DSGRGSAGLGHARWAEQPSNKLFGLWLRLICGAELATHLALKALVPPQDRIPILEAPRGHVALTRHGQALQGLADLLTLQRRGQDIQGRLGTALCLED